MFVFLSFVAGWFFILGPTACSNEQAETKTEALPALAAKLDGTTVSGLSSGAYMAGQFELAHSKIVSGAAIVAGGPFGCAESAFSGIVPDIGVQFLSASRAASGCMLDTLSLYGVPDPKALAERANELSEAGRIGPIADVKTDRIYIFSGTKDQVVKPRIVGTAVQFYRDLGVPAANIKTVMDIPAGHAILTMDKGGSCSVNAVPYVVDCDYDQVGAIFRQLLESAKEPSGKATGRFITFDQDAFTKDLDKAGLTSSAVVYVPKSCEGGGCQIHIAFHGCQQNRNSVETAFIRDTGYGRWADANDVIVLFPEVGKSALNPLGCWDWWGYTGRDYLTRDAPQVKAIFRMLERLASPNNGT